MASKSFNQNSNLYVNNGKFVGGYNNMSTGNTATFIGGGGYNNINTSNYSSIGGGSGNTINGLSDTWSEWRQTISSGGTVINFAHNLNYSAFTENNIQVTLDGINYVNLVDITTIYPTLIYSDVTTVDENNVSVSFTSSTDTTIISVTTFEVDNRTITNDGFIVGGSGNIIKSDNSFIGGGTGNEIDSANGYQTTYNLILGGQNNKTFNASYSSILGGIGNEVNDYNSVIVGGENNRMGTQVGYKELYDEYGGYWTGGGHNLIGGGSDNSMGYSYYSTILGGKGNTLIGGGSGTPSGNYTYDSDTIVGGRGNKINSYWAGTGNFIGGGSNKGGGPNSNPLDSINNYLYLTYNCSIVGGSGNYGNTSHHSSILGGAGNNIHKTSYSSIAGGTGNLMSGTTAGTGWYGRQRWSSIGGGRDHVMVDSDYSTISSGKQNNINTNNFSVIGGGGYNSIERNDTGANYDLFSHYSSIGGGDNNSIIGTSSSTILGGGSGIGSIGNTIEQVVPSILPFGSSLWFNASNLIAGGGGNTISTTFVRDNEGGVNFYGYHSILNGSNNTISAQTSNSASSKTRNNTIINGNNSVISTSSYSTIIGSNSRISNLGDTHIIGSNITALSANTTYVNNLNIYDTPLTSSTVNDILVRDSDGIVKTRTVGSVTGGISRYAASIPFTGGTPVVVTHSLASTDVLVQIKDSTGTLIIPNVVDNYNSNDVSIDVSITGTYRIIIFG